jgi:hypothetical protein
VRLTRCDQGGVFKDSKGRDGANTIQDGAVDLQHGTGLERNLHLCIKKATIPSKGFLNLKIHTLNLIYFAILH